MNLNLKPYLYRIYVTDVYLVPAELIQRFDEVVDLHYDVDTDDYNACRALWRKFSKFDRYKLKSDLHETVLWINPDDLA